MPRGGKCDPKIASKTARGARRADQSFAAASAIAAQTAREVIVAAVMSPDPDLLLGPEERDIGGLGIYLVKKTMDDVHYEYSGGRNILTIRKQIG